MDIKLRMIYYTVAFFLSASIAHAIAPGILSLGNPPGASYSEPLGISADGQTVVGRSWLNNSGGSVAFRWSNGTIQSIGDLPGGGTVSAGVSASFDGSVIVGYGSPDNDFRATQWVNDTPMALVRPAGYQYCVARAVSGDGKEVVGYCHPPGGSNFRAFRWSNGVSMNLGGLGPHDTFASAISLDGTVIVGTSQGQAFRHQGGVMAGLGDLPGGPIYSEGVALSADGTTVVGYSQTNFGNEPFRWKDGVMSSIMNFNMNGGAQNGRALAVSGDGNIIVGKADALVSGTISHDIAFIWDPAHGMRNLKIALLADYGLDLGNWVLWAATAVSSDGKTIAGYGTDPNGIDTGWVVSVPEPSISALMMLSFLFALQRTRQSNR